MRSFRFFAFVLACCFIVAPIRAQQPANDSSTSGPIQPLGPLDTRANAGDASPIETNVQNSTQVEPDRHTLSGAETLGVGYLRSLGHIFDPSAFIWESLDNGTANGKVDSATSAGGTLNFGHFSGHQFLTASYNGGASFYRGNTVYNQQFHNLGFSEAVVLRSWTFRLGDSLMYATQGSFFGGFNSGGYTLGSQGTLLNGSQYSLVPGLQPGLGPVQTINTGIGKRLGNTTFAEIDYSLSARSIVTVEASYGLLHFFGGGFVQSVQDQARAGYNYAIGPKSMIALSYDFSRSTFGGTSQQLGINSLFVPSTVVNPRLQVQSVQLSYGRTIVGRLAWQLGGGPALRRFQNYGLLGGQRFSWSLYSGLTYNTRRTGYNLSYSHGITTGSGVFLGSQTDIIMIAVTRPLTRSWSSSLTAGYARNSSLIATTGLSNLFANWYANADLGRQLGRQLRFDVNYGFQEQNLSGGSCPVLSCGITPRRHVLSINFYWHPLTRAVSPSGWLPSQPR